MTDRASRLIQIMNDAYANDAPDRFSLHDLIPIFARAILKKMCVRSEHCEHRDGENHIWKCTTCCHCSGERKAGGEE